MNIGCVDYIRTDPPAWYACSECKEHGIKLWREYQTFADQTVLLCGECALVDQKKQGPIDDDGFRDGKYGERTDQIGWMVPAIPTGNDPGFWGYSSVPPEGIGWWRRLPTKRTACASIRRAIKIAGREFERIAEVFRATAEEWAGSTYAEPTVTTEKTTPVEPNDRSLLDDWLELERDFAVVMEDLRRVALREIEKLQSDKKYSERLRSDELGDKLDR